MITLYGTPRTRSLRVSWCLQELGLEWHYQCVILSKGQHKSPEFLAINPCGKVPALKDNELVLTESAAICMYLAERYGQGKLLPQSLDDKGQHHRWLSLITCELEQPLWTMAKHQFALPEPLRIPQVVETAQWEFDKICNELELLIPRTPHLFESFTVADILLTHTLNWAVKQGQHLPEKLNQYRKTNSQRPALSSALAKELEG